MLLTLLLAMVLSTSPAAQPAGDRATLATSPLNDVAWLAGSWVGTTNRGAFIEESWMAERDGLMLGSFRWDRGDGRWLFEFMSLEVDPASPSTLLLRLKHFDRAFKGLEERADSTTFRSIEKSASRVLFELKASGRIVRLTYARTGTDGLLVTFDESEPGKPPSRIDFSYTRAR